MTLSNPPYERTLYPEIEPYNSGMLRVSETHEMYFEAGEERINESIFTGFCCVRRDGGSIKRSSFGEHPTHGEILI